ncbi:MAG: hypothetical protein JYX80_14455 [Candidatus Scalindua sediminis]|nr:hypothetical protein [Candidatus Scalindua sediminis]HDY67214.1 hypothetical protein [Candidatus Scalindua sp.]
MVRKYNRESKWDSFDKFVEIIREYVENDYYGGFEVKIEEGKIVDSKDWRRRKYQEDDALKK